MRNLVRTSAALVGALGFLAGAEALATPFTVTSPLGGALPSGVTEIGGIVFDAEGLNGTRVVSQLSAASLFVGFAPGNPLTIGTQSGFTPAVTNQLGGGLAKLSIRFTLSDGDTAAGNFDFNDVTLLVNGVNLGNWSNVATQETNGTGTTLFSSGTGFHNSQLDTGWFSTTNAASLSTIFSQLTATQSVTFQLSDTDSGDNFFDFTQGVDGGLINVGTGPVIGPGGPGGQTGVPEPASLALLGAALAGLGVARRRRR